MKTNNAPLVAFTVLLGIASGVRAQETAPAQPPAAAVTHDKVYRFDPFQKALVEVPANEIKPGFLYYRYSPTLRRQVWSLADQARRFHYAIAPGSVQYAQALDLRASPERQREELNLQAPEVAERMSWQGGNVLVRLEDDNQWKIVTGRSLPRIYDLETLRRWEWHGDRRVAVIHTYGDDWHLINGEFLPASGPIAAVGLSRDCGCTTAF